VTAPRVAVLVVNCNGRSHLASCLPSLEALDYPADRVDLVVVDNGSTDGSVDWVRANHPSAATVRFDRNLGFAAAYNRAVATTDADFVAFLNNDTRVDPGWLRALVAAADRHRAAAVGSVILDWDGRHIDFAGGTTSILGHAWSVLGNRPAADAPAADEPLLFACGGSMLVRREAFLAAEGFDADYFAYFEDVDLGWRLSLAGERLVLAAGAITYHRLHGTAGAWAFAPRLRLYERNALFTIAKCLEQQALDAALPVALALTLARGLRRSSFPPGSFDFGRPVPEEWPLAPDTVATLLAIEDFALAQPVLAEKRQRVQRDRRVPDAALWPLFREPLHVHALGDPYETVARSLMQAFGLEDLVAPTSARTGAGGRIEPARAPGDPARGEPPAAHDVPATDSPDRSRTPAGAPLVTVVVLTALGPRYLPECLDSLARQRYPADRVEVLVVDNGSADDPTSCVVEHYPAARTRRLPRNTGFCAGNNAGARAARGQYLVFLNDDTRADEGLLSSLVETARARRAAAVGATILTWDGQRIDFAGGGTNFYGKGFQSDVGTPAAARDGNDRPVLFACGAGMLIDRRTFLDLGGFDEDLFAYYEDLALGWRLWLTGHEVWQAASALVFHRHHGTSGEWPRPPVVKLYERNALVTLFKHYAGPTLNRVLPAALALAVERALIAAGLAAVTGERRIPRASGLRRLWWRLQPGALARHLRADLAARGAARRLGLAGSVRRVGVRGLLGSGVRLLQFIARDDLARLGRRWAYFLEREPPPPGFDAGQEPVPADAAATLAALAEFTSMLPRLVEERAGIQASRRLTDRQIFGRFARHWLDPAGTRQQREYETIERQLVDAFGIGRLHDDWTMPASDRRAEGAAMQERQQEP